MRPIVPCLLIIAMYVLSMTKLISAAHHLSVPQTLEDLTNPQYKGLLVTENPATSSPGLAFLLATIKHFGDPNYHWLLEKSSRRMGWLSWMAGKLLTTPILAVQSGKGPQSMVVSYGTDPAD